MVLEVQFQGCNSSSDFRCSAIFSFLPLSKRLDLAFANSLDSNQAQHSGSKLFDTHDIAERI